MTKLPEDEQKEAGQTDNNMEQGETNLTGEYTMSNGDVGQSKKHDDFFDEPPVKQQESSYTEKSEHEISNGDVEKENTETAVVEEGEGEKEEDKDEEKKEEKDEEKKEEEGVEEKEGEDAGKDADEAKTDVPAETAVNGTEDGSTNQADETTEQREATENNDSDPAAASTTAAEKADDAQTGSPHQDAQTDTLQVEGQEGRVASSESMYEDDFSQHSEATASVTTPTTKDTGAATTDLNASTDFEEANSITAEEKKEEDPLPLETPPKSPEPETQVVEEGQEEEGDTKRPDSRAEAAAVVPVPVMPPDTNEPKRDGRSSAGGEEMGEYRGEDRKEEVAPEGSEDCRGQGQWRPAEHQAMESAILAQRTDKEALEEVTAERDQILKEYESLKGDSEKSIKDLQERLAVLARENEEKDKRIFRLESDLQEATSKLRESERKLFAAEASAAAGNSEAPKSKTCIVM